MKNTYKLTHIYINKDKSLIVIPTAVSSRGTMREIDKAIVLQSPYNDEELENTLLKSIEQCHSQKPDESGGSILEKVLGVKGYSKATKDKRLVLFSWLPDKGYIVSPTEKKQGYSVISEITLGKEASKGSLADAIKNAIDLSTC